MFSVAGKCPKCDSVWDLYQSPDLMPYFWCQTPTGKWNVTWRKGRKRTRKLKCLKKRRLRQTSPFLHNAPLLPLLQPHKLLALVWHWANLHRAGEATHEEDIDRGIVRQVYELMRWIVSTWMSKLTANRKLGSATRPVLIGQTWVTRKKRNKGGFRGRHTLGHRTCIMAGVELSKVGPGLHETGATFL